MEIMKNEKFFLYARLALSAVALTLGFFYKDPIFSLGKTGEDFNNMINLISFVSPLCVPGMIYSSMMKYPHIIPARKKWVRPGWETNFLDKEDPLHFICLLGCLMIFLGLGGFLGYLCNVILDFRGPLLHAYSGVMVLAGACYCFKKMVHMYADRSLSPDAPKAG